MGQSFSQAVDDVSDKDKKTSLLKAERRMREKLECVKAKLYIGALNDECIPIVCAVDKFDDTIFVEEAKEEAWKKEWKSAVGNIIARHLRMPEKEADKRLIKLVTDVLVNLNLNEKKKTYDEQHIHVVYANESFIRFDYHIHFEIREGDSRALFFYGQVGLIDLERAKLPVLIYELKRATEHQHLEKAAEELDELKDLKMSSVGDVVKFLKSRSKRKGKH